MSSPVLIVAGSAGDAPKPQTMGLRLAENLFQRWFLIVLPVIIMASIGVLMAQRVTSQYQGSATLSTSANPLVDVQEIRGLSASFRESPAAATARVINERLRTDRFAAAVAERAGLADAVGNGFLSYDDLRGRLTVFPIGESLIDIEARWSDPETTLRLIDATIAEFLSVLQSTVTADAQSAVDFYESRRAEAVLTAESATQALRVFVDELGPQLDGDELPLPLELELQRLDNRLVSAQAAIDNADLAIEDARLSVVRAQSQVGASIEMVDPPSSTFEPQSTLIDKATIFLAFVFLGLLIAVTILLLSTHLDRSVRSAADIEAAGGGVTVAAVPMIRSLRPRTRTRRALGAVLSAPGRALGRGQRAA